MGLPSRPRAGRGGGLEYAVDSLPFAARLAWAERLAGASDSTRTRSMESATQARASGTSRTAHVTGWQKERQDAIARVLVIFQRFWQHFGGPLTPALHAFCRSWRANQVEASLELRQRYPVISATTLRSWHLGVQKEGLAAITPKPHHRRGKFEALAGEVGNAALALLKDKPHLSAQAIYEVLSTQFEDLPSDRAFRRALAHWKEHNAQLLEALTNPDGWRNKYLSAAGSADEGIHAPNQLWQMDSTTGDVMLADGKRHAVIGVIDVYTRRRMFLIHRTSRSGAIMSLIRRAITAWGVPAAIKTDNGRDYTAHQLDAALLGLGIAHPLCPPFTPQAKPHIERAIGALMVEHFELLDGFIGHSVAQRKGIESRRSFADRLFDTTDTVELRIEPDQLQAGIDAYCDRLHERGRDELGGRTPAQMAAGYVMTTVAERALDVLLAPSADGGIRVVGKKGIKVGGGFYNHAELGGLEGTQVQVKVDEANLGRCWVFTLDGHYVCEALDYGRLGISSKEVAMKRRAHQAEVLKKQKRQLRDATRAFDTRAAIDAITTERTDAAVAVASNVVPLQRPPAEHTSVGIASIVAAAAPLVDDAQVAAAQAAFAARGEAGDHARPFNTPQERYALWLRLRERVERSEPLAADEATFYDNYAAKDEWSFMRSYFEISGDQPGQRQALVRREGRQGSAGRRGRAAVHGRGPGAGALMSGGKAIHVRLAGMLPPRERLWRAARQLTREGDGCFTLEQWQDTARPLVAFTYARWYRDVLVRAGYLQPAGEINVRQGFPQMRYRIRKNQLEAPRLTPSGKLVEQGNGLQAMWRAMQVLKVFDYLDVQRAASVPGFEVRPQSARSYVQELAGTGFYFHLVDAAREGKPARYRLVMNTGMHPPAVCRGHIVFDRNLGKAVGAAARR